MRSSDESTNWLGRVALAVVFLLAGCASQDTKEPRERYTSELSKFLKTRDEGIYDRTERCLSLWRNYSVEVIDDEHLLFRRRNELWINKLRSRCPQLSGRSHEVLSFDVTSGNMLCNLDTVREIDRNIGGWSGGVACGLGEFHRVAEPFVEPVLERM